MANARRRPAGASKPYAVPAYIGDLIKSINDDAGKARTTALALLLTGLYLAATVIATTDEAMLRGLLVVEISALNLANQIRAILENQ